MKIAEHHYQRIVSAKLFIDEHFYQPIRLHTIARNACLSRFHFHRLFSTIYQCTPHQYLTRKRIGKAAELLKEPQKSIADICLEVGFESPGSFSLLFKKEMGFTPQYYRNSAFRKKQLSRSHPTSFIPHCFIESQAPNSSHKSNNQ
jgi:AraC-like DNA-binding protein